MPQIEAILNFIHQKVFLAIIKSNKNPDKMELLSIPAESKREFSIFFCIFSYGLIALTSSSLPTYNLSATLNGNNFEHMCVLWAIAIWGFYWKSQWVFINCSMNCKLVSESFELCSGKEKGSSTFSGMKRSQRLLSFSSIKKGVNHVYMTDIQIIVEWIGKVYRWNESIEQSDSWT